MTNSINLSFVCDPFVIAIDKYYWTQLYKYNSFNKFVFLGHDVINEKKTIFLLVLKTYRSFFILLVDEDVTDTNVVDWSNVCLGIKK